MSEINWNQMNEIYEAAPSPTGIKHDKVPDGSYTVAIHTVDFRVSENGNPYLFWVLKIAEGPHTGRTIMKQSMLKTQTNMGFFKKDIASCGVKPPESIALFSDADNRQRFLGQLLDIKLRVSQKTKNGYGDVYIEHRLEAAPLVGGPKPFEDDGIPF
jgi:hypothetical protein